MYKKTFAMLLIGTLLASVAVAAEKSPKKKKAEDIPVVTAPAPKTVVKPWEPTAFGQDVDRLPPNYPGLDPVKFFEMFKSKVGSLKKGEFETSEEFAQRTADKDALLAPINTTYVYAFRISNIPIKYDADAQTYVIGGRFGYSCKETYSFGKFKDWVTCKVSPISRDNDTYVGSNAYGASRTVERTRGRDFAVAIAKGSAVLSTAFTQERYFKDDYSFQDRLPVPLEKARDLKDMKVSVLFVGRITDAKIIEGRGTLIEPKVDSPTDLFIMEEAVPFELKKIIYYVIQTGEILAQRVY
jgi:hypothetical protein